MDIKTIRSLSVNGIFSTLSDILAKITTNTIKLRSIKKEDLRNLLTENIKLHQQISKALDDSNSKSTRWVLDSAVPALRKAKNPELHNLYNNYASALHGKATSKESANPLGALSAANREFAAVCQQIVNNLDQLMEEEMVDIFHMRVSLVGALGIVSQSDTVCNFSVCLYTLLTDAIRGTADDTPKYRMVYMKEHFNESINYICNILDKKGLYTFLQDVKSLRSRSADVVLGATGKFDFLPSGISGFYMPNFLETILSALSYLNIFRVATDLWDDYQLAKYRRNKEIKAWLEARVALLRMELANMDHTSPEYIKLSEVIKSYDEKITEYDRKIFEFENAD